MNGNSLTNVYDVLKRRKSSLNAQRNPLQRNDVREHRVSHDVSPHQSAPLILQCENISKLSSRAIPSVVHATRNAHAKRRVLDFFFFFVNGRRKSVVCDSINHRDTPLLAEVKIVPSNHVKYSWKMYSNVMEFMKKKKINKRYRSLWM